VQIRVAPNVPDLPITLRIENATAEEAIRAVIAAARESLPNLTFRTQGMGYVIELGK
jgi:hypothetical protein